MRYEHECLRCGHQWDSRSEFPSRCRGCGSCNFDVPAGGNDVRSYAGQRLSCSCGHIWMQKGATSPDKCPNDKCQRNRNERILIAQVAKYAND